MDATRGADRLRDGVGLHFLTVCRPPLLPPLDGYDWNNPLRPLWQSCDFWHQFPNCPGPPHISQVSRYRADSRSLWGQLEQGCARMGMHVVLPRILYHNVPFLLTTFIPSAAYHISWNTWQLTVSMRLARLLITVGWGLYPRILIFTILSWLCITALGRDFHSCHAVSFIVWKDLGMKKTFRGNMRLGMRGNPFFITCRYFHVRTLRAYRIARYLHIAEPGPGSFRVTERTPPVSDTFADVTREGMIRAISYRFH
jgi:hypothetical protein